MFNLTTRKIIGIILLMGLAIGIIASYFYPSALTGAITVILGLLAAFDFVYSYLIKENLDEKDKTTSLDPFQQQTLQKIWNIPHHRNPNFTGRESLIKDLHNTLNSGHSAALTQAIIGLGGIGKTQLAVEYAYRYANDYDIIWWLRAEDHATLVADYVQLADKLNLPEKGLPDQREVIHAVRNKLEQSGRWLLIFDNAHHLHELYDPDNPEQHLLPSQTSGHIIITSRDPHWNCIAQPFTIKVFDRPESIEFLLKRTGKNDEQPTAGELADELGNLPLALEQAGAYIAETPGFTIIRYLELYRRRQGELLKHGKNPTDHKEKVHITWIISVEQVRQDNPAAAELLNLLAFFAPENIPINLLKGKGEFLEEPLKLASDDEILLRESLACLRKYSLIESYDDTITIHRLVQLVIRDNLDEDGKRKWCQATVLILNNTFVNNIDDVQSCQESLRIIPHTIVALGHAEELQIIPTTVAFLLNQVGCLLRTQAEYRDAKQILERALAIYEKAYGPEHPFVATPVNNLGNALQDLSDLDGAKKCYERALAIYEKAYGPEHPFVATSVNNLGNALQDLGDPVAAKKCFERALAIDEKVYGPDHPEVALIVNNLGLVLLILGDRPAAKTCFERALAIDEKVYGPYHPEVANRVNNLGGALNELGDLAGAKKRFEQAMAITEKVYGPDHPAVATCINNLGGILNALGDRSAAKTCFERALAIDEKVYGRDHPEVANRVNNLGGVLHALGDLAGAKICFERALAIDEKVYGPDHPNVVCDIHNLGCLLQDLGDHIAAEKCFEREHFIRNKHKK